MLRIFLQRLSSHFQSATESYKRHNNQYEESDKLERERLIGVENIQANLINSPSLRAKDLLGKHAHIQQGVDIGSGTGWSAAALSPVLENVIAIEPSAAAITISKSIYPTTEYKNIVWINGFAEDVLPTLSLDLPSFFMTGCVLSHIRDIEVEKICAALCAIASSGSVLTFDECWGETAWHQRMWHVRTKEWWQQQLPGWTLDFHGPVVPEKDGYKGQYHKGFWGVKK